MDSSLPVDIMGGAIDSVCDFILYGRGVDRNTKPSWCYDFDFGGGWF